MSSHCTDQCKVPQHKHEARFFLLPGALVFLIVPALDEVAYESQYVIEIIGLLYCKLCIHLTH